MKEFLQKYGIIKDKSTVLAYWWSGENNMNFGDIVTPYLIEKITGKKAVLCSPNCLRDFYLMTGSIIRRAGRHSIVWGTGMMFRQQMIKRPKEVHAVRGPLTRARLLELGYECPEVYGDPALLLPRFYSPARKKKYKLGIIPHFIDYKNVTERVADADIHVINLLAPVEEVVNEILQCEWTISSSLHGVIVSQTYGIPSHWVKFSTNIAGDDTKYKDYFLSVGIEPYAPGLLSSGPIGWREVKQFEGMAESSISIDLDKLLNSCPLVKDRGQKKNTQVQA